MYSKAALSSMGFPHSGHSGGVRGRSALSMVLRTSTKGTWAATAPHSSGAWFTTAPMRVPPALPPEMAMRPSDPYPSSTRWRATSTKSLKVLVRWNSFPRLVPVVSQVVASPDMGNGVDEAPVQEGQPGMWKRTVKSRCRRRRKRRCTGAPTRPSGVSLWRTMDTRDLNSVPGGGQFPVGYVLGRIIAAGNLLDPAFFQLPVFTW